MADEEWRKFITTEPMGRGGERSESKVWDAVKEAFSGRECIGYWRYPIFSRVGHTRKEPDILVADKELGLIVIEVKGLYMNQITSINGHRWEYTNFYTDSGNPYEQGENQYYALLRYCDSEPGLRRRVSGRVLVALPQITKAEWQSRGFDRLPSTPPILFKDQLSKMGLFQTVSQTPTIERGKLLSDEEWSLLKSVLGGGPVLRKASESVALAKNSRSAIIQLLSEKMYDLDLQQEHIGKEIPPGPQRIRGIAGSGKTVLLCQKAVHMHLKHPDWDIAFVFFTRSLYDQILTTMDKWMRHFTNGEAGYDPSKNKKLKILHAWGARDREGFYSTVCDKLGVRKLSVGDLRGLGPSDGLAEAIRRLCRANDLPEIFDAVIIDEGQDLIVDETYKLEDKQPIYWLAFQTLRAVDPETPEIKRLIWGYDEAQSLDNLRIPSAAELFGRSPQFKEIVAGSYIGGIQKSIIMHRCYRTPGPILVAAHAIGMGLLRPDGMLSGLTRKGHWEEIGYKVVDGSFIQGRNVVLHRPPSNSPNPIPSLWSEPVFKFRTYSSRQEELIALVCNIKHNVEHDRLKLSRQILIVVLGTNWEAIELERTVAHTLMEQGIQIFIPTAQVPNDINPRFPYKNPDKFWHEDAVTISRIHRAKGNEADMVYVIGFDNIARNESNINLRNQVFVALTRARGWAELSGVGQYPLYDEMDNVIESGDTFRFTFKRPQRQNVGEEEQ